jgi:uncharacterized membrane protein
VNPCAIISAVKLRTIKAPFLMIMAGLALSAICSALGSFPGVLIGIVIAWFYTNLLIHLRP